MLTCNCAPTPELGSASLARHAALHPVRSDSPVRHRVSVCVWCIARGIVADHTVSHTLTPRLGTRCGRRWTKVKSEPVFFSRQQNNDLGAGAGDFMTHLLAM